MSFLSSGTKVMYTLQQSKIPGLHFQFIMSFLIEVLSRITQRCFKDTENGIIFNINKIGVPHTFKSLLLLIFFRLFKILSHYLSSDSVWCLQMPSQGTSRGRPLPAHGVSLRTSFCVCSSCVPVMLLVPLFAVTANSLYRIISIYIGFT